jgi:TonB family protein
MSSHTQSAARLALIKSIGSHLILGMSLVYMTSTSIGKVRGQAGLWGSPQSKTLHIDLSPHSLSSNSSNQLNANPVTNAPNLDDLSAQLKERTQLAAPSKPALTKSKLEKKSENKPETKIASKLSSVADEGIEIAKVKNKKLETVEIKNEILPEEKIELAEVIDDSFTESEKNELAKENSNKESDEIKQSFSVSTQPITSTQTSTQSNDQVSNQGNSNNGQVNRLGQGGSSDQLAEEVGNSRETDIWGLYLKELTKRIQRSLQTPGQLSQEFTSHIQFNIENNGSVTDLNVAKSSGVKKLDFLAMDAVKMAMPFKAPPKALKITVPVLFRINR